MYQQAVEAIAIASILKFYLSLITVLVYVHMHAMMIMLKSEDSL